MKGKTMRNIFLLIYLIFSISSCCCTYYEKQIIAKKHNIEYYDLSQFKNYQNFDSIYKSNFFNKNSTGFKIENKIFLFEYNLHLVNSLSDSDKYKFLLIKIDTNMKNIEVLDIPPFKDPLILYETENYYFFIFEFNGNRLIWREPFEKWVNGIIILHKSNIEKYQCYQFVNKIPENIKEVDEKIRIVLSIQEAKVDFWGWSTAWMSDHINKWKYVTTGEYEEIIIDSTQIVSQKVLSKEEIFK